MIRKLFSFVIKYYALLIGLAIATTLSFITSHSDFFYVTKMAERVAGGNFNIYDNLIINGVDYGKYIMPPTIFLIDGAVFYFFKLFNVVNFDFGIYEIPSLLNIFLLKTRFILLLALSYPLVKRVAFVYTKNEKDSTNIANIWITSPVLLYLTFTQGNNDIYPTLISVIFLYFAFKRNYLTAMIFLGICAATKNYALFLILPMAIIFSNKNVFKILKYSFVSIVVYLVPVLIYIEDTKRFLTGGGEGLFILETAIPAHFNYLVFPILYVILLSFMFFSETDKFKDKNKSIVFYGFLTLSLFFATSFFIPQWFLWILPFFVFLIYKNNKLFSLYVLIVSIFMLSLLTNWSNNLDLQLYRPILPLNLAEVGFPGNIKVFSFVSSLFVGLYLSFVYFLVVNYKKPTEKAPRLNVLMNLIPLVALFFILSVFAFISTEITKSVIKTNDKVIKNNFTIIEDFSSDSLKGAEIINAKVINNNEFSATTNDPMIILELKNEVISKKNDALIFLVKYRGNNLEPQLYWDRKDFFSEKLSTIKFYYIGDDTYWAKINKNFMGVEIKNDNFIKFLRFDPIRKVSNFSIDYIKIIKLNN